MLHRLHRFIITRWILTRMAAQEFYFRQPFDLPAEFPILKTILVLALFPLEAILIFLYARLYGSVARQALPILIIATLINIVIANIIINRTKGRPYIHDAITRYTHLDPDSRRRLYSFRAIALSIITLRSVSA